MTEQNNSSAPVKEIHDALREATRAYHLYRKYRKNYPEYTEHALDQLTDATVHAYMTIYPYIKWSHTQIYETQVGDLGVASLSQIDEWAKGDNLVKKVQSTDPNYNHSPLGDRVVEKEVPNYIDPEKARKFILLMKGVAKEKGLLAKTKEPSTRGVITAEEMM